MIAVRLPAPVDLDELAPVDTSRRYRSLDDLRDDLAALYPDGGASTLTPLELDRIRLVGNESHADRTAQVAALVDAVTDAISGRPEVPAEVVTLRRLEADLYRRTEVRDGEPDPWLDTPERPAWSDPDRDRRSSSVNSSAWQSDPVSVTMAAMHGKCWDNGRLSIATADVNLHQAPVDREPIVVIRSHSWKPDGTPAAPAQMWFRLDEAQTLIDVLSAHIAAARAAEAVTE
ncbi:hypothetical protein [Tsukamurella soli]|uniref:ESX secretion-associated protein EspG n=1 Tax=Tsukamurella soli TaxID=644556 RepID=A0ABP8J7I0_9ACTN